MSGALAVSKVFSGIAKTVQVVESGYDIHRTLQDEKMDKDHKAHRVATNVIFIMFSTLDYGLEVASCQSSSQNLKNARVLSRIATGGVDVAKVMSRKISSGQPLCIFGKDGLDLLGIYLFRMGDMLGLMVDQKPLKFNSQNELAEEISGILVMTAGIINGKTIYGMASLGKRIIALIKGSDALDKVDSKIGKAYVDEVEEVVNANSINDFERIPMLMESDPILSLFICQITGKPIRFILVVKSTRDGENPIYYEKEEIEKFLSEQSPPTSWPDEVIFSQDQLIEPRPIQHQINRRLENLRMEISDEMKKMEKKQMIKI